MNDKIASMSLGSSDKGDGCIVPGVVGSLSISPIYVQFGDGSIN